MCLIGFGESDEDIANDKLEFVVGGGVSVL